MNTVLRFILLAAVGVLMAFLPLSAQKATESAADTLEVGLLTCAPGAEVYELYGHTALRVRNHRTGADRVFNYGIFDFNAPHFTWRFALGKADYYLRPADFNRFAYTYYMDGRSVEEQVLNLTPVEEARVLAFLDSLVNIDTWAYRYSFLYDNCTTRAIDVIERCIDGEMLWPETWPGYTFRSIIHEFTATQSPWNRFGQDLILGAEVDAKAGRREQMFSPLYAQSYVGGARIKSADGVRPLVLRQETVVLAAPLPQALFPLSPMMAVCLFGVLTAGICLWERKRQRICRWYDDLLLVVQGLAGCIVALLFFFSAQPAVGSNWLVLWLNPLPLLYLPWKIIRNRQERTDYYYVSVAVAVVLLGVSGLWGEQKFPVEIYVLALFLLVRSSICARIEAHRLPERPGITSVKYRKKRTNVS